MLLDDMPEILTVKQVAKFLRLNRNTVVKMISKNKLKGIKTGKRGDWKVRRYELMKFVDK